MSEANREMVAKEDSNLIIEDELIISGKYIPSDCARIVCMHRKHSSVYFDL
jgi:hypothetical protein